MQFNLGNLSHQLQPKVGQTAFIGIDGHGGAGKSSLAGILADQLQASIIHTDDFASWDNPLEWWRLLEPTVFEPIRDGAKTLSFEVSEWEPNSKRPPVNNLPVTPIMILEGVSALRSEFRPVLSLGIFVDTPLKVCISRGVERDIASGSAKTRSELQELWQNWAQGELSYFANHKPQAFADVVIDGTKNFHKQM